MDEESSKRIYDETNKEIDRLDDFADDLGALVVGLRKISILQFQKGLRRAAKDVMRVPEEDVENQSAREASRAILSASKEDLNDGKFIKSMLAKYK